ncbi:pentatricopeptide repeat-containing protein, partial [Tanacetum coccineum]
MILGSCHNSRGDVAIDLFEMLNNEGLKPDNTTFQGVLLACICEGRVELGRRYFDAMTSEYCVIPRLEHYELIIELYSRYGFMGELKNFVKQMPFDPTASMLIRIFDACLEYKREQFGKWAADRLNDLNPTYSDTELSLRESWVSLSCGLETIREYL